MSANTAPIFYTVITCNEEGTTIERKRFGYASYTDPHAAAADYVRRAHASLVGLGRDGCTVSLSTS